MTRHCRLLFFFLFSLAIALWFGTGSGRALPSSLAMLPRADMLLPATPTPEAERVSTLPRPRLAPERALPSKPLPPRTGFRAMPIDLSHLKGDRMPQGVSAAALPSRWDWREQGIVTRVQNQGACGSCYSFASLASFESRLQMDGAGNFDFSENNVKECNWEELNNYFYFGNPYGSCDGGTFPMVASLLAQKGTVLESCDPYVANDVQCKTDCTYQKTLLDWRQITGDVLPDPNVLKGYIQTYGPLYTSIYAGNKDDWDIEFARYDGSYTLYHPGTEDSNHAVLIVGWDDNLTHAGGKGGWIVKNSWGTGWGGTCGYGSESGYFTIAYGSASIGMNASYVYQWQDYDPYGGLLLLDEAGWNGAVGFESGSTTAWGLVKLIPTENTNVTRAEFWTTDRTSDVDVYIYDNFDGDKPSGLLWKQENLSYNEAGYHSVLVNPSLSATSGDDLIVVVKFSNAGYDYPIAIDSRGPRERRRSYISANGGDGTWSEPGLLQKWDVGIRLRTSRPPPTATPTATPTWKPFTPTAWARLPMLLKTYRWVSIPTLVPGVTPTPTGGAGGWVTIVSEDFEGNFPGPWQVADNNPGFGQYYWGKRNCRVAAGAFSGWAVGGGADGSSLPCGSRYPNSADSAMVYGPFSLVNATAAELGLRYWLNCESNNDTLFIGAARDGMWFWGLEYSGAQSNWQEARLDLSNVPFLGNLRGWPQVWVALIFTSDDSTNYPEGAYVDNIVLRKCTSGGCAGVSGAGSLSDPHAGVPVVRKLTD